LHDPVLEVHGSNNGGIWSPRAPLDQISCTKSDENCESDLAETVLPAVKSQASLVTRRPTIEQKFGCKWTALENSDALLFSEPFDLSFFLGQPARHIARTITFLDFGLQNAIARQDR
jgi:hypothetical protein